MRVYNPNLLKEAKSDFLIRILNMYSRRGVELASVQQAFAKIHTVIPKPPTPTPPIPEENKPDRVTDEPVWEGPQPPPGQPITPTPSVTPGEPVTQVEEKTTETQKEKTDELDKTGY